MASRKFIIVNINTNEVFSGPFGRKKIQRIFSGLDDKKFKIDKATGKEKIIKDIEADHVITSTHNFQYRTGVFKQKESVEDLMNKLEVTDFVIEENSKGYYSLYND